MLPEDELSPPFFERVERFAPIVPDFFVEEVRLDAAAVRVLPEPLDEEPLLEEDFARLAVERDEVPPLERPPDFVPDERELEDFVPDAFLPPDERPVDFVPDDRLPPDFAPDDLVPDLLPDDLVLDERELEAFVPEDLPLDDFAPEDFVPEDFAPEDLVPEDLVPEDLAPDFAPELFDPDDLDLVEELFAPPLDRELLRADVPLLFRAVEDLDEPLRERLPLPLEDEPPPLFSLWLVFDLSSVGICRLLLGPSRGNRHACKATSIFVLGSKQRPVSQVEPCPLLARGSLIERR